MQVFHNKESFLLTYFYIAESKSETLHKAIPAHKQNNVIQIPKLKSIINLLFNKK